MVWVIGGACGAAMAQAHVGDILVDRDVAGRLRTGIIDQGGALVPGQRVFNAVFGEAPNFTNDPGLESGEDAFPPSTRIGFTILSALREWDAVAGEFRDIPPERISVRLGPLGPVLTPTTDVPVTGFSLTSDSFGRFHHHPGFTLQAPASAGIYVMELSLWSETAGILPSRPYFIVFNQQRPAQEQLDAAAWVARFWACPGDVNDDRTIDLADFFAFFEAYDLQAAQADVNNDDSVDLADFFDFFGYFDTGC